jgi:hypothetical protein
MASDTAPKAPVQPGAVKSASAKDKKSEHTPMMVQYDYS